MSTYRELVYLVLDEMKGISDDFTYTEDHLIFVLSKLRAFLLKQRYFDIKKQMPESNYLTICLDLIEVPAITGEPCEGGSYLRSQQEIPTTMPIGDPRVYPLDFYQGEISYISRDRMRYVGCNRFLKNIIYSSLGPDNHLYFKSSNPLFLNLEKVRMTAIFEDALKASELQCNIDGTAPCELIDRNFPIEDALVPPLVQLTLQELLGANYRPKDLVNNANDDLANMPVKNDLRNRNYDNES